MITCCEIAITLALGSFTVILALLAMFFNYNLKLDARTVKLEKKNGKELKEIEQLRTELTQVKNQLHALPIVSEKKNPV